MSCVVPLAVPEAPVRVAVIVMGPPTLKSAASPFVPVLKAAIVGFDDDHVAELVRSTEPLLHVPVAVNCTDPTVSDNDAFVGVIWRFGSRPEHTTLTVVEPLIAPTAAVMVAVPVPIPLTRPLSGFTVAMVTSDDDQSAATPEVLPSAKVPVAIICTVASMVIEGVIGVTVIAVSAGVTQKSAQPSTSKSPDNAAENTAAIMTNCRLMRLLPTSAPTKDASVQRYRLPKRKPNELAKAPVPAGSRSPSRVRNGGE